MLSRFTPVLLALLVCFASLVKADEPEAFANDVEGRLFTVQGSNTIGASLMKNFLIDYLQVKGARDVQAIALDVANEYRVQGYLGRRPVYVDVAAHGSSTGFRGLLAGSTDLAMSSRRIKSSEVEQLRRLGNLRAYGSEHVVAIDGLAVIVNSANPIQSLKLEQIAKVFSGEISNWRQLGGEDLPINLYARDENSGTWDTFASLVLSEASPLSSRASRFESNDELSDRVAADPRGIGFVGLASVRRAKALAVSDAGAEALRPEVLVVATEDYALSRRLFLYASERQQNAFIADFLAYVQSDRGQQQVERTGFVSQNLISVADHSLSRGPSEYLQLTKAAQRLSVNLRFAEGSAELDNKAQRDILRIVRYMEREENARKRLVLVGFGDAAQRDQRAVVLSKLRAMAVKSELFRRGVMSEPVMGLGALLPVASMEAGSSKNQRVEVWVYETGDLEALKPAQLSARRQDHR